MAPRAHDALARPHMRRAAAGCALLTAAACLLAACGGAGDEPITGYGRRDKALAMTGDAGLSAWGLNVGRLGDGTSASRNTPVSMLGGVKLP